MGLASRRKGKSGEREVVNLARKHGLWAKRCWETAQSAKAEDRGIDVIIHGWPFQVKRRKAGFGAVYAAVAEAGMALIRQDGERWLAVVPAEFFFDRLKLGAEGPLT